MNDAEQLITIHGEQYRLLIVDALEWLAEREPKWGLPEPMDRAEFIEGLLDMVAKD